MICCKSEIISLQENNERQTMLSLCKEAIQLCWQCFSAKAIVNLQRIRPK